MCGSSFINESFRDFMMVRLETQRRNIENVNDNIALEGLVESEDIMTKFEMNFKRRVNWEKPELCQRWFKIAGLKVDLERKIGKNKLFVSR
jgi:hypothetical protein